ncbi:CRISPR-associated endonuclease Cas2 [Clostridium tyrobutyricum]|jgi:CRISPR-associated protein Cas2|uniref:CRISPR-associated endoribonuclease Cas2 n=1 Tax=Clostridium tyrobutyricum DIVETGP TaxID=1408889 RepID=W6N7Y4_CLOTY|nr:CRISPR-associated endonuclease Cas2 [Clostridium tyrobutyricum]AND85775.1 CRISPR-associated endoribonuclease Cas2 [Clostridium tyrobutyricum]ANP70292.1 CRISPR-associated endonuclease Cas2 [Clostridium tyrobutyricum]MBR9648016.1 CRISPR-associated endonuclease Cas2 [Clostridium tyrobutyricum]MBV4416372.1 CRISPR-associated endonuclease Cas2 [Clostridium tyrobutyricum]MBV4420520.1 CRISPR-associated endonuclease Cas2 [Clostridium tyrobutyricum]
MGKNFNFNYAFVFYDVNEKRVNKIFKICKKYFHHHQNSVFRGSITPSKLIKLKSELNKIVADKDFVTIIKLINDSCFEEETLGINDKNTENLIL